MCVLIVCISSLEKYPSRLPILIGLFVFLLISCLSSFTFSVLTPPKRLVNIYLILFKYFHSVGCLLIY